MGKLIVVHLYRLILLRDNFFFLKKEQANELGSNGVHSTWSNHIKEARLKKKSIVYIIPFYKFQKQAKLEI